MDSDDSLTVDCIDKLLGAIGDCDAVACGINHIFENGESTYYHPTNEVFDNNDDIKNAYMYKKLRRSFYYPFAKIFRRSIVGGLTFNETLAMSEDIVFNLQFLQKAAKVKTIDYIGYLYWRNNESLTHTGISKYTPLLEHDYHLISDAIIKEKRKWGFDEEYLLQEERSEVPTRCWNEIANLFKKGSPYSPKEIMAQIKIIVSDEKFRNVIYPQKIKKMSLGGKLAKVCMKIHFSCLIYCFVKFVLFAQDIILKLFGVRNMKKFVRRFRK